MSYTYRWVITIKEHGTIKGVIAQTKWEAVERVYAKYNTLERDRSKYKAKKC